MPTPDPIDFILNTTFDDHSTRVIDTAKLNILDTLGIAVGGHGTKLSEIIRSLAVEEFGGECPMLFDGRTASTSGVALAAGMLIDSLDGHDGFNPAKGHIGAPLLSALLPVARSLNASGREFLNAVIIGYEVGARVSVAQHATCPDYHTSGSWGAVAAAAAASRLMGFDRETIRHAIGIAEYHGPRSQMMRCIDHPTMLKDGAGWGAMTGVSAVKLASKGFTGAPAITVESAPEFWADLGERSYILEQYYKPYPVCRWAQGPIEGVLALRREHNLNSDMVEQISVTTFHESVRLALNAPTNTEEAQYSTSYPCAVAMVRGTVTPEDIADETLSDPEILRLSKSLTMTESTWANEKFPQERFAKVTLSLRDGRELESDWVEPIWDAKHPPAKEELVNKYRDIAMPVLGTQRASDIENAVFGLQTSDFSALGDLLFQPIND